jgi:hypothetical protein
VPERHWLMLLLQTACVAHAGLSGSAHSPYVDGILTGPVSGQGAKESLGCVRQLPRA